LNIPKIVSKNKLGKEIIEKLFLFFFCLSLKKKLAKIESLFHKKNGEETFHIWGKRCPQDLVTKKSKINVKKK
jgi:hypothetical protein